jgi:hypothetical protein
MVVAPEFPGARKREADVLRIPAIQNFNGSDFSLRLPVPGFLFSALEKFRPDVVHSHHPYLLGDTALRISALRNVPLVFTHHTMYENSPITSGRLAQAPAIRRRAFHRYANLCNRVIVPSGSTKAILMNAAWKRRSR